MKKLALFVLTMILSVTMITTAVYAQKMDKKYKTITVSRIINQPAEKVWEVVGGDYGYVANTHPKIYYSNYEGGSLKGGEGIERVCHLNEKGTKIIHERIVGWNPAEMTFTNQILATKKLPLDKENSRGVYTIKRIDDQTSEFKLVLDFRTKPAFMAVMAKGQFKKLTRDYMIGVEHHMATGEIINASTDFKKIRKLYKNGSPDMDKPMAKKDCSSTCKIKIT